MATLRTLLCLSWSGAALALLPAIPVEVSGSSIEEHGSVSTATAGPRTTINFERGYCEVEIGNIHYSPNHRDASARTSVSCYFNSATGRPFKVDNISIRTFLETTECKSQANRHTNQATMPCHAPFRGFGKYTASTNVKVTVAGRTHSASASVTKQLP